MPYIKSFLFLFLTFASTISTFAKDENSFAIIQIISTTLSDIKIEGANAPTLEKRNGKFFATIKIPTTDQWQQVSICGKSTPNTHVYLTLQTEKRRSEYASFFDDVKFNGKHHTDKGFELGQTAEWVAYGDAINYPPQILLFGAKQGDKCMLAVWTNPVQTRFESQQNGDFTISFFCKNAGKYKDIKYDNPIRLSDKSDTQKIGSILDNPLAINLDTSAPILLKKSTNAIINVPENSYGRNLYILSATKAKSGIHAGTICVNFKDGTKKYFDITSAHRTGDIETRTATRFTIPLKTSEGKFLYLTKLELQSKNNNPQSIKLVARNNDWLIASITLSERNYDTIATYTPTAPQWIKADFGDNPQEIVNGSPLDFSANVEANAGSKGRIIINKNGKFAFANEPEKSLRFHSTMTTFPWLVNNNYQDIEKAKKNIDARLLELKRCGYNLVRVWGLEVAFYENATLIENKRHLWDYFMEESRKAGFYLDIMLPLPYPKTPTDWYTVKTNFILGDKYLNNDWAKRVTKILERKNTISGTKFCDHPHILALEYINEIGIGPRMLQARGNPTYAVSVWQKWLEKKFGNIEKINALWKTSFKKFSDITAKDMLSRPQWNEFIIEHAIRSHNFCESVVRKAGYKGLINQYNYDTSHTFSAIRANGTDYVAMNSYQSHPYYEVPSNTWNNWSKNQNATVNQESSAFNLGGYFRRIAQHKLADRPMLITEYKNCFWNQYQYEDALIFPAYASFQDFSAICSFIKSSDSLDKPIGSFTTGNNPTAIVNEVLAYCLFARGDVSPSKHRIEIPITKQILRQARLSDLSLGWQQSLIPLMTGFAMTFPDMKTRESLNHIQLKQAYMKIAKDGYSSTIAHDFFAETIELPNGKFDLKKFIAILKEKKILSPENISDSDKYCYQTDNNQISIFKHEKKVIVNTPRTEGVALLANTPQKINSLEVKSSSENAMVALTSIDNKPIKNSSKLLLIFSTASMNSNMKLSEDLAFAKEIGTPPALIKTAKLHAKIKLDPNKKFKLYAIAINGEIREEIPFKQNNNVLEIDLDTSKFKHGATPFFLINEN